MAIEAIKVESGGNSSEGMEGGIKNSSRSLAYFLSFDLTELDLCCRHPA